MPELFRPAKELLLGARERDMRRELQLQKVKCADEVGNLEEPVTGWLYVNGEFNLATEACLESLMKKPRDRGLSTVIVYLDMVDGQKYIVAQGDEFGERHLEPFDDLLCGIDIPFIHRKAMVSIVNPSGKGHHAGEYPTAQLTAQHGVVLFPNKKREWRDANLATHAESFPRIPVTHAKRRRSVGILAYRRSPCNGECKKR